MHIFQYYRRAESVCLSSTRHNMKKVVVKVPPVENPKKRQKAFASVAGMEGVVQVSVNNKGGMITVVGQTDPVAITRRLKKLGFADLISVGPVGPAKDVEKPTRNPTVTPVLAHEPHIIYCPGPAECRCYDEQYGPISACTIM